MPSFSISMTPEALAKRAIGEAPEEFGLLPAGAEVPAVEGIEIEKEGIVTTGDYSPREKRLIEKWRKQLTPSMVDEQGFPLPTLTLSDEEVLRQASIQGSAQANILLKGAILATGLGNIGKVGRGWKIGGKLFTNSKQAVKTGTGVKNTGLLTGAITKLKGLGVLGWVGLYSIGKGIIGIPTGLITRKIAGQQQAINTLGQITSTIVGDSKTGAGDWRKGLQELNHLKQLLLDIESDLKQGTIKSSTLKFNGATYDIDADIYDQLATINEGIRDIQDFVLLGKFPELTEFEIQSLLRELEAGGFIEPVDLTEARRAVSEPEQFGEIPAS